MTDKQQEQLRAAARAEVRRLVAQLDDKPWAGSGRWPALAECPACGRPVPGRAWCAVCAAVL